MTAKKVIVGFRQSVIYSIRDCQAKAAEDDRHFSPLVRSAYRDAIVVGDAFVADQAMWDGSVATPFSLDDRDFGVPFWVYLIHVILERAMGKRWNAKPRRFYLFHGDVYAVDAGHYSKDQELLLVRDAFEAERRKLDRLKNKFDVNSTEGKPASRSTIPESVRIEVWRRDAGKCSRCGSRERLEFDHIIPVSRGGGNTARNIELLCEVCNRSKSDNIQ